MRNLTVIIKGTQFENPAQTEVVSRHTMGGEDIRVIEYPLGRYYFEHDDKFDAVLPIEVPKCITAMTIEDNNPVMEATLAEKPGIFVLDIAENTTVTVDFNKRLITVTHDRVFSDYRIQLNFHYKREQVA